MFALEFLRKSRKREVQAIHINHSTPSHRDDECEDFCRSYCESIGVNLHVVKIDELPSMRNAEALWSALRREIYHNFAVANDCSIVTGHNLDDAVEWWMIRAMSARPPKLISPLSYPVVRPFLTLKKAEMREWLSERGISNWFEDPTNLDGESNQRSFYRKNFAEKVEEFSDLSKRIRKIYRSGNLDEFSIGFPEH